MNCKHLYYFWKVAKHGGVLRASEAIHISPQALSGQIKLLEEDFGSPLFKRRGRSLELTEAGDLAYEYAEKMFTLGAELDQIIRQFPHGKPIDFRVGVSDALPKSLAYRLLRPAIKLNEPIRIVCREWSLDRLLAELALHRLDLVLSDSPVPPDVNVKAYSRKLGESGVSFIAHAKLANQSRLPFPGCLEQLPLLMPGEDSAIRRVLNEWLDQQRLRISIAGEFDDAALMAAFGSERIGAFPIPTVLADEYLGEKEMVLLGHVDTARIGYYSISVQRHLTHPCVVAISEQAEDSLRKPN